MSKRNRLLRIGFRIATVCGVLVIGALTYHMARVRLCDTILAKIDRLVLTPPDNTTELEWAVHVYWTHNLHCNSMLLVHGPYGLLRDLDRTLDKAINNGPDRQTIDAIWDKYAQMTPGGAAYQQAYESEKNSIAESVAYQGAKYRFASDYQDFVQYERSER